MKDKTSFQIFCFVSKSLAIVVAIVILGLIINDRRISWQTSSRIYYSIQDIPDYPIAIVLGTSKFAKGNINKDYQARIDAASHLFASVKIGLILVSGDASSTYYDEPTTMQRDLINRGIPAKNIVLDYAGIRTLDSIFRAKTVYKIDRAIVVSQEFHCERALYLADSIGLAAIGFCVENNLTLPSLTLRTREVFARAVAYLDLNLFHTQPVSLGREIKKRKI